ncbi:MAG: hypothetical protein R2784_02410 [Saprospiraceae bacterium]
MEDYKFPHLKSRGYSTPEGNQIDVEATEITEKKIADSEFEIPEGFEVKTMSEMLGF